MSEDFCEKYSRECFQLLLTAIEEHKVSNGQALQTLGAICLSVITCIATGEHEIKGSIKLLMIVLDNNIAIATSMNEELRKGGDG